MGEIGRLYFISIVILGFSLGLGGFGRGGYGNIFKVVGKRDLL